MLIYKSASQRNKDKFMKNKIVRYTVTITSYKGANMRYKFTITGYNVITRNIFIITRNKI